MKYIYNIILIYFVSFGSAMSQGFYYGFDSCSLQDMNGQIASIVAVNDINCVCGVIDNGLEFDGIDDYFILPDTVKSMLQEDFTFGFSFWLNSELDDQTLFSVQDSCDRDSMMAVRYLPAINKIELNISKSTGIQWNSRAELDPNKCWHRFVLTKKGSVYSFYLDNQFIETFDNLDVSPLSDSSQVFLGYSQCVGSLEELFDGKIDEIFLDNDVWSFSDIKNSDFFVDQIITPDTTIFVGNSVEIMTGNTCSSDISWSPVTALDNPLIDMPIASPDETTTYTYKVVHDGCTVTDEILINVISEEQLLCSDLLLPNVFTPNNDNVNDQFGISNSFLIQDLNSFEIFDRWGGKLYSTSEKNTSWDGQYNGEDVALGMYLYRVEYTCKDENFVKQGSFSVMR